MTQSALIVEDTPANRDFFERLLTQARYEICGVRSGREALDAAAKFERLDLAVVDMQIPDMSGLELILHLRRMHPDVCLVIATMHDERSLMESAFARGCNIFLVKPHGFMELFKRLTTQGAAAIRSDVPVVIDQYGPRPFMPAAT